MAEPKIKTLMSNNQPESDDQELKSPAEKKRTILTWVAVAIAAALIAYRYPGGARTTIIFLLILGVLVFVHEWGHYQFGRWAGMKINRFAIGFPPWVFTKRYNDIDYSIGALPLGGMVDIAGLGSEEEMVAAGKEKVVAVSGAETADGTRIVPEDTDGDGVFDKYRLRNPDAPHGQKQFQDASLGWRFLTLFAGPMMNFIFAIVVFIALFSVVGLPSADTLRSVESIVSGAPADKAGIVAGDEIIAVDGKPTKDTKAISDAIRASKGKPIAVTLQRKQETLTKTLTPEWERPLMGKDDEKVPLIGVQFAAGPTTYKKVGLVEAASAGFITTFFITGQIKDTVVRALTGKLSRMERQGIGGPVRIAQEVGNSAREGWVRTLQLTAALSVNLGLLNLLPLPALDGGRILFLAYELVMRKPLDPRKEGFVHAVGMAMLLAFMLFITVRDIIPMISKAG